MSSLRKIIKQVRDEIIIRRSKVIMDDARRHRDEVKKKVFEKIRNHPVSRELMSHKNPSSFLGGKRGTLFGFLGFSAGADPVGDLISFLDMYWKEEPVLEKKLIGFTVSISMRAPGKREMKSAGLVLPWQPSLAWPYFIQAPLSNLPYYLYVGGKGRSKEGFQIKNTAYEADFDGVNYISEIFESTRKIRYKRNFKL